jgi:hypothetical protein
MHRNRTDCFNITRELEVLGKKIVIFCSHLPNNEIDVTVEHNACKHMYRSTLSNLEKKAKPYTEKQLATIESDFPESVKGLTFLKAVDQAVLSVSIELMKLGKEKE